MTETKKNSHLEQSTPSNTGNHLPDPDGSGIRSGLIPFSTQIASMTIFTPTGGLFIVLTMVISWLVKVFRAARALSKMGKASPRSWSHSSLIACAALACSLATASSALTTCENRTELELVYTIIEYDSASWGMRLSFMSTVPAYDLFANVATSGCDRIGYIRREVGRGDPILQIRLYWITS